MIPSRTVLRTARSALVTVGLFTVILGLCYPLTLVGIGMIALPHQAAGSPLYDASGQVRGSALLAQQPQQQQPQHAGWFYPRPSAGEGQASNMSPADPAYAALVEQRRVEVAEREQVAPQEVPAEAVAASGSGLDPHISRTYAEMQVPRVARNTGLAEGTLRRLIAQNQQPFALNGSADGPPVNVTTLNAAVAEAARHSG
ncbi:potassium-transporting ATPase subunit C [Corynebacterium lowii]|uniref:Potassium-transporting ATPase KdpC subunit n=1 Tax=Corynebacterium lowii TaxID=1544413 RepID=A0A0Q0UJ36_9CORY|nr:potassium-transporting ATPase subunit C [Corynebacterium lowii]KQB86239.1 Potassium-transporting ATPase C chain [Corynebacterium lowii]MDP9852713.1 K+-transporting ATPase ATPase C chain [Corynebacterium lowii]